MKCPACQNELKGKKAGKLVVDICEGGCGGIWFDNFELQQVDEPDESAGDLLLDIQKNVNIKVDHNKKRKCPKCNGIFMMSHFFSVKKKIAVDECPNCGGFWLDAGELGQIRSLYKIEDEREKAADEYFSELFDKQLNKMFQESKEKADKARKIALMFKYICPSYYIPGKQEGAAF